MWKFVFILLSFPSLILAGETKAMPEIQDDTSAHRAEEKTFFLEKNIENLLKELDSMVLSDRPVELNEIANFKPAQELAVKIEEYYPLRVALLNYLRKKVQTEDLKTKIAELDRSTHKNYYLSVALAFEFHAKLTKSLNEIVLGAEQILVKDVFSAASNLKKGEKLAENNLERLKKWAQNGHMKARELLGDLYLEGKGVEKNEKLALDYLNMAAESGSIKAMRYLSRKSLETKDYHTSLQWIWLMARQGGPESQGKFKDKKFAELMREKAPEFDVLYDDGHYLKEPPKETNATAPVPVPTASAQI